jgi:hypothetical protein
MCSGIQFASLTVLQILHVGLGDQLHSPSLLRDAIAATQLRLHRNGQICTVRSRA